MITEKGQSLWEVVMALAIAGIIALGLVRVSSSAVKSTRFSSDQSQATALAQKKIGQIIDYKNNNPITFWTDNFPGLPPTVSGEELVDGFCLLTVLTDVSSSLPTETPNLSAAKMGKIKVDIFWDLKGSATGCRLDNYNHNLNIETYITN